MTSTGAGPQQEPAAPRQQRNPWLRALAGVWGGALIAAAVLGAAALIAAFPAGGLGRAGEDAAAVLLSAAGWFLTLAAVAVVAQLAALAAAWRPPER